jgi:hypothetical protein
MKTFKSESSKMYDVLFRSIKNHNTALTEKTFLTNCSKQLSPFSQFSLYIVYFGKKLKPRNTVL